MRGSRGEVGLTRGRSWTIMQTWQCPGQLDREPVGQRYCLWPMLEWNGWVLLSMPYLVPGCGLPWKGYDIGWVSLSHFLLDHSTWGCQPSWCEVALQRGSRGDGLRDHVSELGSGPFKPLPQPSDETAAPARGLATTSGVALSYLSHMLVHDLQKLEIKFLF